MSRFHQPDYVEFVFQPPPEDEPSDVPKQCIYGHRHILSVRCPYFHRMFTSGMKESNEMEIKVTDVDYDTFLLMVKYLYTGTLSFEENNEEKKQDQVAQMYKAMHKYLCANSLLSSFPYTASSISPRKSCALSSNKCAMSSA